MDAYFTVKLWEEIIAAGILLLIILAMILMVAVTRIKERSKHK